MSKIQKIYMKNNVDYLNSINTDLIWNNINSSDIDILKHINNQISNPYSIKLNFIQNILNSNQALPIKTKSDLEKFFNALSPFNIEFNFGSSTFNKKIVCSRLLLHNSISKKDSSDIFYNKYINKVKNLLVKSGIEFDYFEFKSKRFNKTKDIIWVFNLEQFDNNNSK